MLENADLSLSKIVQWLFGLLIGLLGWLFRQQNGRIVDLEDRLDLEAKARQDSKDGIAAQIAAYSEASAVSLAALRRELGEDVRRLHEKMDDNQATIMNYLLNHKGQGG